MSQAPPAARAWLAAGVRHQVLMRVMPSLRHDMAGPLSVVRMGNAVLKRYLDAEPADIGAARRRLEQNEGQLQELLKAIRGLNRWELTTSEHQEAALVVASALHLARPMLDLHGSQLEVPEPQTMLQDWPPLQPARGMYAVIGALCYLQDSAEAGGAPGVMRVLATPDGALQLGRHGKAAAADSESGHESGPDQAIVRAPESLSRHRHATELAPASLPVDRMALECLAESLRWPFVIGADSVTLPRPPAL